MTEETSTDHVANLNGLTIQTIVVAAMDLFIGIPPLAVFIEHRVWCHSEHSRAELEALLNRLG
jgi:hypothetical protein